MMDNELSLPLSEFYVSSTFYVYPMQISTSVQSTIRAMAAADATQTTLVQVYVCLQFNCEFWVLSPWDFLAFRRLICCFYSVITMLSPAAVYGNEL